MGKNNLLELLLKKGANPNEKTNDTEGLTALHISATGGNLKAAELLISYGGNVNEKDPSENTPLHNAVQNGHFEIVKLLLTKGANINAENIVGFSPLALAKNQEIAEFLISNGAEIKAMTSVSLLNRKIGSPRRLYRSYLDMFSNVYTTGNPDWDSGFKRHKTLIGGLV